MVLPSPPSFGKVLFFSFFPLWVVLFFSLFLQSGAAFHPWVVLFLLSFLCGVAFLG